jgi:hypothetical protein
MVNLRKSRAGEKGWVTRTKNEGYKQTLKALAKRNPVISNVAFGKDIVMGSYKMAYPRHYRRNSLAKRIEKKAFI